jgi:hypothetical protein
MSIIEVELWQRPDAELFPRPAKRTHRHGIDGLIRKIQISDGLHWLIPSTWLGPQRTPVRKHPNPLRAYGNTRKKPANFTLAG